MYQFATNFLSKATAIGITLAALPTTLVRSAMAACGPIDIYGGAECGNTGSGLTVQSGVQATVNTLLFIVGVASVIVIIVGGLRYVLSGGDPKNTAAAKDTILYAAIGLVVSLLAYAIVNFVLDQFL
ncbi:hypothetical protein IT415_02625 [bacterium]|nr:hypothetical protein [bacterium]